MKATALLTLIHSLLDFIADCLSIATKQQIRTALIEYENRLKDTKPWNVLKAPLRFISDLGDQTFGARLVSKRAFRKSAKINLTLLVLSLFFTGLFTKTPFGLNPAPWQAYSGSIWFLSTNEKLTRTNPKLANDPNTKEVIKIYHNVLSTMDHHWLRTAHSLFFFVLVVIFDAVLGFISLSITRQLLREIVESSGPLAIFCILLANFFFLLNTITFFIVLLGIYLIPPLWLIIWVVVPMVMTNLSAAWIYVGIGTSLLSAVVTWWFAPIYIKVIVILGFLPAILLVILSIVTLCLHPGKNYIRLGLLLFCRRSIEHEKGPLGFLISIVLVSIAISGFVASIWK